MKRKVKFASGLFMSAVLCVVLAGCAPLQKEIEEYSGDKELCSLNTENVTQFTCREERYTILEDTVSNDSLGEWVGYIRKLAVIDENGKILLQESMERITLRRMADLADSAPNAAYMISFLNVYAAEGDSYLIVDVDGEYHKAISTDAVSESDLIFDFRTKEQ